MFVCFFVSSCWKEIRHIWIERDGERERERDGERERDFERDFERERVYISQLSTKKKKT